MRAKFRYGIAALLISSLLMWEIFCHNKPYVYYIGFGIETFAAITPEYFYQYGGATRISVAELERIERRVAEAKPIPGGFDRRITRFLGMNNGRTVILIDADGGFEMDGKSGRLCEADKKLVENSIRQMMRRYDQRP